MAHVGVLALQGAFVPHEQALRSLGHRVSEVRDAAALASVDGLVLPGGESTTLLRLLARHGLEAPLDGFVRSGRPVLATCAGLILAARSVSQPEQKSFGWLDVDVQRNGWGAQVDSFEAVVDEGAALPGLPLVFIRAPRITRVGAGVEVMARYAGEPVLVRSASIVGATFHTELTEDLRLHRTVFGNG
jgi:5'-phosphate synthase pdxT subunit